MNAVLEQEIIQRLHTLDEPKLVEVLDFVDFLAQRRRTVQTPPAPPRRRARGAMKGMLSSVDEFIADRDRSEAKPVGGFRPFPARGAQVTNEQVNHLRDEVLP